MHQIDRPASTTATPTANASDLLLERVAATPDLVLFSRATESGWADITAAEFLAQVQGLAKGFIAAGIEPGQRIGLLSRTRYEWSLIDFAAWFAGVVLVPIYETSSPFQIRWNLGDSEAVAVIVEDSALRARVGDVLPELPNVELVWTIDDGDLDVLAAHGTRIDDIELERRRSRANEGDIATIIYTSGTTGTPKGCVLTHRNFVELSRNTAADIPEVLAPGASTLLFLPLTHVFARFIAVVCVYAGVRIAHQGDTNKLIETLGAFKPTFLLAVPRVFEKVYNSSEQRAEAGGRGKLFRQAAEAAIAYSKALDHGHVPFGLRVRFAVLDRLVLSKLRTALGGRMQFAVSGGGPLGERLGHFYRSLGVSILEGYGLTETTAPATVSRPGSVKIGTVGPPLPGVSVRIAHDSEVEITGVNVFKEYWRNPAATAAAFDDGWLRTGDLGSLDDKGNLTITGRKKEIIVTAGGKNVAPAALEDPIRGNPIVGQAVVVGDRRPFIAALITLDVEMLPVWLRNNGLDPAMARDVAAAHPEVRAEVQRAIDYGNSHVSRAESIRTFVILPTEFTEESGHLTPKLSTKRSVILDDFAGEIELLYAGAPGHIDAAPQQDSKNTITA
ncbi:long-chain fatty acid--CoA ligase [Cryobacterium sp. PH29-G1]|uniref:AMP-dependent synthetase/ligase n=1 Tax=Cryobacterium sp. PH29-G1 TaxID=3046211 RepID=UPI0024BBB19A|nr:long-chain fatty acid--CoA ligase [Cryobacterium sp. PH29-G1]MDJ0349600.1 AMP-binding protein [Cryobacterium sp. PH29-G1]